MSATSTTPEEHTPTGGAGEQLTVAVTGASGRVGPALLSRLAASDSVAQILALGRHPTEEMSGLDKVEFRRVDVRDVDALGRALRGVDVVAHLAFSLYGIWQGEAELFETNVRGTANVARAAVAAGARRFVYTSSAAVYGGRSSSDPLPESAEMRAPGRLFYARHKTQAELLVRKIVEDSSAELFVLRPCGIAGPHAAGAPARHLTPGARRGVAGLMALAGRFGVLPAPPVPVQFVHEDDVAQAVELALLGDGPAGTYNLAGEGILDGEEAVRLLGARPLPVPRRVVSASLRMLLSLPPVIPALSWPALVIAPVILDTRRAREQLGWKPRYSSAEALASTRG
jgi:nucleoside-diphosphate-sugar epimerase